MAKRKAGRSVKRFRAFRLKRGNSARSVPLVPHSHPPTIEIKNLRIFPPRFCTRCYSTAVNDLCDLPGALDPLATNVRLAIGSDAAIQPVTG